MTLKDLELRLTRVEAELSQLRGKNGVAQQKSHINSWIDEIHGTFTNDATYQKAARLGREWRESFRPRSARTRKAK